MNSSMAALLASQEFASLLAGAELVPQLRTLAQSEFVELRGCTFLKQNLREGFDVDLALSRSADQTELECGMNTVYVDSYLQLRGATPAVLLLVHGYIYARELSLRLDAQGRFRVICSYHGGELFLPSCDVRFHRARRGHEWLVPNLEHYRLNSIVVFDTGVSRPARRYGRT